MTISSIAKTQTESKQQIAQALEWQKDLLIALRRYERLNLSLFHLHKRQILSGRLNGLELGRAMQEADESEANYLRAERCRDLIASLGAGELIALHQRRSLRCAA